MPALGLCFLDVFLCSWRWFLAACVIWFLCVVTLFVSNVFLLLLLLLLFLCVVTLVASNMLFAGYSLFAILWLRVAWFVILFCFYSELWPPDVGVSLWNSRNDFACSSLTGRAHRLRKVFQPSKQNTPTA